MALSAVAMAPSACGGPTPSVTSDLGEDAPVRVNDLREIARFGLLFTDGEPLVDPTELVDAASFDGIPSVNEPVSLSRERADEQLVVLWAPRSASPLEGDDVRDGRDVGISGSLTFRWRAGH